MKLVRFHCKRKGKRDVQGDFQLVVCADGCMKVASPGRKYQRGAPAPDAQEDEVYKRTLRKNQPIAVQRRGTREGEGRVST